MTSIHKLNENIENLISNYKNYKNPVYALRICSILEHKYYDCKALEKETKNDLDKRFISLAMNKIKNAIKHFNVLTEIKN